jgi:putative ABC transport system permease protein
MGSLEGMNILPLLRFSVSNLLSRPMRSSLALLGLTVAIMGMVLLFSVAAGLQATITSTFNRIPGLVAMQPGTPIPLFSRLPLVWADEIARLPGVRNVTREVWSRAHVVEGKPTFNPPRFLFGCDVATTLRLKSAIYRDDIVSGRFLTLEDANTSRCVISRQISEDIGKQVGDTLRVDGYELEIVGIYECGSILLDVAIIVDGQTGRTISKFEPSQLASMYIEPDGTVPNPALAESIRRHFRGRPLPVASSSTVLNQLMGGPTTNGSQSGSGAGALVSNLALTMLQSLQSPLLQGKPPPSVEPSAGAASSPPPNQTPSSKPTASSASNATSSAAHATNGGTTNPPVASEGNRPASTSKPKLVAVTDEDAVEIRTAQEWGQRIQEFGADLDIFLFLMNLIGVVIALLSILNTMLMSVSERLTEFGILRANGWSGNEVVRLILGESAVLGLCGGLFGCACGIIGSWVLNAIFPTKLLLYASPTVLGISLLFSVVLGMVGGLYPALYAVRVSPMDAIRRG